MNPFDQTSENWFDMTNTASHSSYRGEPETNGQYDTNTNEPRSTIHEKRERHQDFGKVTEREKGGYRERKNKYRLKAKQQVAVVRKWGIGQGEKEIDIGSVTE